MMQPMRFALYGFSGNPKGTFFRVEAEDLKTAPTKAVRQPSHHILILDVSGSMYYDIGDVKATVEKLFTLEEFNDPNLRVSLITYSSKGDVKLHFSRVTVGDVMRASSPYLQEIRSLAVRGLTCISQSLMLAESLIDDKETTCVSLHSDGFANHLSPTSENREIQAAVDKLRHRPNTFVNTVAYRDYCDFNLLSGVANQLSGRCIQAKNIRQVYEALHDTTALLAGAMSPVIEVPVGKAAYVVLCSTKGRKVVGSNKTLAVRGLGADDDATAFRYFPMTEAEYAASKLPVCGEDERLSPVLAYCRAQIADGNINTAKFALVATRDADLLKEHARALTSSQVAAMASDVEKSLFDTITCRQQPSYGLLSTGPSLISVFNALSAYQGSITVNQKALQEGYKRRGLKRVAGVRKDDGTLEKPLFETRAKDADEWLPVSGVEFNRNTATLNLRLRQPVNLVEIDDGKVISEIAGIKLDLQDYRNYTIVGDGTLNVASLVIRTSDKRCFQALKDLGAAFGKFDPKADIVLDLSTLPLVDYDQTFTIEPDVFEKIAKMTVLSKALSAIVKEQSAAYSPEQVAELKRHHITPALYFSPPTTNAYTDLDEALNKGEVDTRPSYKVDLGTPEITGIGKLMSGNAFLQRRFTATNPSWPAIDKPTLDMFFESGISWGIKKLSARTQVGAVDNLMYPIFAELLGIEDNGALIDVLTTAGLDYDARKVVDRALRGQLDQDGCVDVLTRCRRQIDNAIDALFFEKVSPLVFYIGSTGLVPDELRASAFSAEQMMAKFPDMKLSKDEKEDGTFFLLPNGVLLTVFVSSEYFTVDRPKAA